MGPTRVLNQDEIQQRSRAREELVAEKDETELRLEKLLFGDEAGFLDALKAPPTYATEKSLVLQTTRDDSSADGGEDSDIGDVPDEELFFLDAGTAALPPAIASHLQQDDPESEPEEKIRTWYDSDDERLTISLGSHTRLRKLRDTEADDVVTGTEYIRRLRRQYERLHPEPEWIKYARKKRKISHDSVEDSDSDVEMSNDVSSAIPLADLLRSTSSFTRADGADIQEKGRKLRQGVIDIQRLKDVANKGPSSIDTLQFHPSLPLVLSAGPSSTASIYHLSPEHRNPNPLVTSLHVKNMPLHTASFCNNTANNGSNAQNESRVFLSSRRRYFHSWSLSTGVVSKISRPVYGDTRHEQKTMEAFKVSPCGRYMGLVGSGKKGGGSINVLSTTTMQWICSCRIDSRGGIADFAWWSNGEGFAVIGKNGEVSEYEIESRKVLVRWTEEGSVGTTVIALGGRTGRDHIAGDRWVAVGSTSGVVSVYDRTQWFAIAANTADGNHTQIPTRPKPARVFDQLTTPISHLEFAQDGQMLVMGSRWKKNALKLVHLPSCTIYQNWPTDKTPLGRISSLALSQDGGYLAVANEQGRIRLWQIRS